MVRDSLFRVQVSIHELCHVASGSSWQSNYLSRLQDQLVPYRRPAERKECDPQD